MNPRLKWSLVVGFVLSLSLHIASAVITALYPYHDVPLMPKLPFLFLLWPGWGIAGGNPYPLQLWREAIAVVINGALYGLVIFFLLTVWKGQRRGRA